MDISALYLNILDCFPYTIGKLSQPQVYYWWNRSFESQYKLAQNQYKSAAMLIERAEPQGVRKIFERACQQYSVLGFTMPLFDTITGLLEVEEYHVDATCGISCTGHELFGIVAQVNGIGIPIAYFLLKMNNNNNDNDNDNN